MISRVHAACISGGRAAQHRQRRRRATIFSQNISFERPCTASEFPGNLVQVKAFDTVIPTSGATWPDRVAGLEGYDSWEQDYGRTFTSASLRETEIDLLVGTRGRRPSTRFSDNGRKRSTRRSSSAPTGRERCKRYRSRLICCTGYWQRCRSSRCSFSLCHCVGARRKRRQSRCLPLPSWRFLLSAHRGTRWRLQARRACGTPSSSCM